MIRRELWCRQEDLQMGNTGAEAAAAEGGGRRRMDREQRRRQEQKAEQGRKKRLERQPSRSAANKTSELGHDNKESSEEPEQ